MLYDQLALLCNPVFVRNILVYIVKNNRCGLVFARVCASVSDCNTYLKFNRVIWPMSRYARGSESYVQLFCHPYNLISLIKASILSYCCMMTSVWLLLSIHNPGLRYGDSTITPYFRCKVAVSSCPQSRPCKSSSLLTVRDA